MDSILTRAAIIWRHVLTLRHAEGGGYRAACLCGWTSAPAPVPGALPIKCPTGEAELRAHDAEIVRRVIAFEDVE